MDNTLKAIQQTVGGPIQAVYLFEEPVYTQCSEKMMALSDILRKELNQEAANLLDRLEDIFVKRETASVEGAFREGARVAIVLALDLFLPSKPPELSTIYKLRWS